MATYLAGAPCFSAGHTQELIRQLDQTLPEWVVAGSLVETARELAALGASIARVRELGVSEEVTGRLSEQSANVATDLWALAERMVSAEQTGSRDLRSELEQQDASLVRLSEGMREARDELLQLSLGDAGGADDLERAERRLRTLAATAREIHGWERERLPEMRLSLGQSARGRRHAAERPADSRSWASGRTG